LQNLAWAMVLARSWVPSYSATIFKIVSAYEGTQDLANTMQHAKLSGPDASFGDWSHRRGAGNGEGQGGASLWPKKWCMMPTLRKE